MIFTIGDTHGLSNLLNVLTYHFRRCANKRKCIMVHPTNKSVIHNRSIVYRTKPVLLSGTNTLGNSTFIHVGDVGIGFHRWYEDMWFITTIDRLLKAMKCRIKLIRGNHDNPLFWNYTYNVEGHLSWTALQVHLVKDYTVLKIEGNHVLFIGGAVSIDRHERTEGVDWWKDEVVEQRSDEDLARLATKKIDVVITHSAPSYAYPIDSYKNDYYPQLERDTASERTYLQKVYDVLNSVHPIKHWCYGHFHKAKTEYIWPTKFQCCDIEAITELR
mgnify:CR=1 FL=1